MKILNLEQIKSALDISEAVKMQEQGFKAYSEGQVNVPPIGHIGTENPAGSYHIKYGHINHDAIWVLKVAGAPSGKPLSGMMMAISTETGKPVALLQDDGFLTSTRTAMSGLIAAKYLAPKKIKAIGVLGTGLQARMQVKVLKNWSDCRKIYVWGRNSEKASEYKSDMEVKGYSVEICSSPAAVAAQCNLIITTTSAREPLLKSSDIQPGTHITAMGADNPGKQELDPEIFTKADLVVLDSKPQCFNQGDAQHPFKQNMITENDVIELGKVIANPAKGRSNDNQITIFDSTGVAVQDIQITKSILGNS